MADRRSKLQGRGRPPYPGFFTPAEQRVLDGLRRGLTYQQIADELHLSYDTVKYHVSNMLSKAQVDTREQLVEFARRPGLRWGGLLAPVALVAGSAAAAVFVALGLLVLLGRDSNDEIPASGVTATATASPPATRSDPRGGAPSVGLDARGVPSSAAGTVVVYAKHLAAAGSRFEVVAYDISARKRLSTFTVSDPNEITVQIAGTRVLVQYADALWSYAVDGSDARLVHDGAIAYVRPSPNGSLVAVTCGNNCGTQQTVWTIDVATGQAVREVDVGDVAGWRGEVSFVGWTVDGGLVLAGLCHCDGPAAADYPIGVFHADGTVNIVGTSPLPSRGAVVFEGGAWAELGYEGATAVRLLGPDGELLGSAPIDAPLILGSDLSPDGTQAAIYSYQGAWFLQSGQDSLTPAADRLAIMEDWYGSRLPVFACGGEERAGYFTSGWLLGERWVAPVGFGAPWGFTSPDCGGRSAKVDLRVGTVAVDSGGTGYDILGFIDPRARAQ